MSQNKTREIEVTDSIVDTVIDKFVTRAKFGNTKEIYYFPNVSPTQSDFKKYLIK